MPSIAIPDITYYISGETLELQLPVVTVSDPDCLINYKIWGGVGSGSTFTTTGFPTSLPLLLDVYEELRTIKIFSLDSAHVPSNPAYYTIRY